MADDGGSAPGRHRRGARTGVTRHRRARRRTAIGGTAALAAGLAATLTAVSGAVPAGGPPAGPDAPGPAVLSDRQAAAALADRAAAADRAQRSDRTAEASPEAALGAAPTATRRAAEPERSPEPEPPAWVHPLPEARVSSCYGWRWGRLHAGVDLAGSYGADIHAAGDGTVVEAGWQGGYGISVLVDHGDGVLTQYGHADSARVSAGEKVAAGDTIAVVGSTGNSTGPHLHFEVHEGRGNQVDPAGWLDERGVDLGGC